MDKINYFLGINTAMSPLSFSLINEESQVIFEHVCESTYNATENMMVSIKKSFKNVGISLSDLGALGVVVGPGNYTSLRIGVTIAKTIAQIYKIPIYPINALEVLLGDLSDIRGVYFTMIKARKNEVNIALLTVKNKKITSLVKCISLEIDHFIKKLEKMSSRFIIIGELPLELIEKTKKMQHIQTIVSYIRGVDCAKVVLKCFKMKKEGNFTKINPKYSHQVMIR